MSPPPQAIGAGIAIGVGSIFSVSAAGAATTVGGATVLKAIGFIAEGAITYAIAKLLERHDDPDDDPTRNVYGSEDQTSQQTVPYQRLLFGTYTVVLDAAFMLETSREGSYVALEILSDPELAEAPFTGEPGSYLVDGYLICNHRTAGLENISFIGSYSRSVNLEFDPDGYVRPGSGDNQHPLVHNNDPFLAVSYRDGRDNQAVDKIVVRNFPDAEPDELYGENYMQQGHTTIVTEKFFGRNTEENRAVWQDEPVLRPRIRGALVFDPRDPQQDPNDSTTWKHSRNSVLIAHWLLQNKDFLGDDTVSYNDFDYDMMKFHADICDRGISTLAGDFIPQYTCDGYCTLGERPFDVFAAVLESCSGKLLYRNGSLQVEPGYAKEPVGVVTDKDIIGDFEYQRFTPASETISRVIPRGILPEANYQTESAPFVEINVGQVVLNERAINFRFVEGSARLQRLSKIRLLEANQERGLSVLMGPVMEEYDAGDVITVDTENFQFANNDYEILTIVPGDINNTWEVVLAEYDPAKYEWDGAKEEKPVDLLTFRTL